MVIIKVSYLAALKQELEDFVRAVVLSTLEHSNSGKKVSIRFSLPNRFFRFDSIHQSDKFAASTLILK